MMQIDGSAGSDGRAPASPRLRGEQIYASRLRLAAVKKERFSPLPACGERAAKGGKPAQQARVRGRLRKRRSVGEGRLFLRRPSPPLRFASLRCARSAEGRTLSPQAGRGE